MATTRQITAILTRHLGVDVTPWAARLVREGMLPRRGEPIDEREIAALLLAVFATSDPDRAIDALTTLEGTSLRQVEHAIAGTAPGVRAWRREANETFANMAESPLDLVAEALQGGIVIDWMAIHDGGGVATFEIVVAGDRPFAHRLGFMDAATQSHSGIMRLAQIDGAVIGALVGILRDDEQRAPAAPASLELH